jgi:casein kinase II subunit beta
LTEEQQELVDAAAENLYGLIHARYIITSKGLNAMYDKFVDFNFGRCPRVLCEDNALLPVGRSDLARKHTVALYCPRCNDIYHPRSTRHSSESTLRPPHCPL